MGKIPCLHQLLLRHDLVHEKSQARLHTLNWEFVDIEGNYWLFFREEMREESEVEDGIRQENELREEVRQACQKEEQIESYNGDRR